MDRKQRIGDENRRVGKVKEITGDLDGQMYTGNVQIVNENSGITSPNNGSWAKIYQSFYCQVYHTFGLRIHVYAVRVCWTEHGREEELKDADLGKMCQRQ